MKERPILFSAPMVRAIIDGRKTQTRRVVKPQPALNGNWMEWCHKGVLITEQNVAWHPFAEGFPRALASKGLGYLCPYGQPGDRLWVRETWMPDGPRDGTWDDFAFFGCKGSPFSMIPEQYRTPAHVIHRASWDGSEMTGWKPSIHMPRWASRITLEITGVRVERLKDISDADAAAEGFVDEGTGREWKSGRQRFGELWESINGPGSWNANPWVWVVEFKRIEDASKA